MFKKIIILTVFLWVSFIILIGSNSPYSQEKIIEREKEVIKNNFVVVVHDRDNINNIINLDREYFINFFKTYYDNENIPIIMEEALRQNFPVTLGLALSFGESSWKARKYNDSNKNGSVDRGLFQLNSLSYPFLTKDQFYDPRVNAKYGIAHIKELYLEEEEIVLALTKYNCGSVNRINPTTLAHISNILDKEKELNNLLVKAYEQFEWGEKLKNSNPGQIL